MADAARPSGRLDQLDGLRAVLLALVWAQHLVWAAPTLAAHWVEGAWAAVDVFFVLSGYLICGLLMNEHDKTGSISYRRFMGRRLLRLYPAMLVTVLVTTFVAVALNHVPMATAWPTVRAGAFYYLNWPMGWQHQLLIEYTHLWTLAVEFQFYLVFPLVVIALTRLRATFAVFMAVFGSMMAAATVFRVLEWHGASSFPGAYVFTHTRFDALLWGAVAALIQRRGLTATHRRALRMLAPVAIVFLGLLVAATDAKESPTYDWWMIGSGAAGLVVVLWLVTDGHSIVSRFLATKPMAALGQRSYGGYLWHYPVFFFVTDHLSRFTDLERAVMAIVGTILLSDLTFRFVEIPFFKLKDRLVPGRSRDAVPQVAAGPAPAVEPTIVQPASSPEPGPAGP